MMSCDVVTLSGHDTRCQNDVIMLCDVTMLVPQVSEPLGTPLVKGQEKPQILLM